MSSPAPSHVPLKPRANPCPEHRTIEATAPLGTLQLHPARAYGSNQDSPTPSLKPHSLALAYSPTHRTQSPHNKDNTTKIHLSPYTHEHLQLTSSPPLTTHTITHIEDKGAGNSQYLNFDKFVQIKQLAFVLEIVAIHATRTNQGHRICRL